MLDRAPGGGRAPLPPDEVDEVRIVAGWLAEHEPAQLELDSKGGRLLSRAGLSG